MPVGKFELNPLKRSSGNGSKFVWPLKDDNDDDNNNNNNNNKINNNNNNNTPKRDKYPQTFNMGSPPEVNTC